MSDELNPHALSPHALSHELYLRALGATALVAWLSLHIQIDGLFGPNGLLPMTLRIEALEARDGASALWETPSLLHAIGGSSGAMHTLAILGELAALGMIFGVATGPLALLSYVLYLSFVSLGWPFLPLQWDTLLLEALVVGALLGRWRNPRASLPLEPPGMLAQIVGFSLVTRLMLASGLVKVLSGDPAWLDGTALAFHHWSQPLPSPLAPFLHALPAWVHRIETYATLLLEIGAPLLVFAGARGRRAMAAAVVFLMTVITLSGSYGFFNLLTVVLCIPLLDDAALGRLLPRALRPPSPRDTHRAPNESQPERALLVAYLACAAIQFATSLDAPVPTPLEDAYRTLYRTHVAGHYGLFARMTVDRPELVFEGSSDGLEWEPYDFWYKPGDPARGPSFCAPHMPRVDWMLWFAAIPEPIPGSGALDPWVVHIARGLLEDRSETRALFRSLPLHGERPVAVRLVRARYTFADDGPDAWRIEDREVVRTWRRR